MWNPCKAAGGGGATKCAVFQTWATGSATLHTRKQNACLCAGEAKQLYVLVQSAHADRTIRASTRFSILSMQQSSPYKTAVVHTRMQCRCCNMHRPYTSLTSSEDRKCRLIDTELNTCSNAFWHDIMQYELPVQLKQQLWICRQEVSIYITFNLLKDACYLASVQHLGQSMQLCILLPVRQVPGALASTSSGLGCSTGPAVILHVLKEVCMLQKRCVANKVVAVSMPQERE